MTNDSTYKAVPANIKEKKMYTPKITSINFIRQFARACSSARNVRSGAPVLN